MNIQPASLGNARRWRRSAGLLLILASAWSAASQESTNAARLDYTSFRLITERNIFNAGRVGGRSSRSTTERPRPRSVDAFGLVGTLQSEKGLMAFFDGTSSDYRKVLQTDGSIAGHKVSAITANSVRLVAGTNKFELRLGMQMRREEEGPWQPSTGSESFANARGGPGLDGARTTGIPSFGGPRPTGGFSFSGPPNSSPASTVSAAAPASASSSATEDSEVLKRLMQKREQ